jgi:hypothetical protein
MMPTTRCILASQDWTIQPIEKKITCDDLIDAYILGANDQKKRSRIELIKKIESNLLKVQNICSSFYNDLVTRGYSLSCALLKFESINRFHVIYVVSEEQYESDSILDLYKSSLELKEKVNSSKLYVSCSFLGNNKNINEARLISDGYIFVYGKQ